jgi:hypothetical protein
MTTIEMTVTISINPNEVDLEALEAQIGHAMQQAGNQLLVQASKVIETQFLEEHSELRRSKRRGLHLLTRFGWIRLSRWQVRDARGRFFCPLDQVLGLQPRQHDSPWITRQAVALATRIPYRQAAHLLSGFLEEEIDHRSLYRWMQRTGAQIVEEEDEQQAEVFEHGVVPPRDHREREIVLAEVDGTFLRAQREESDRFEVRLGVLTTGKSLVSKTAKHQRYQLEERVRYGGVETAQDFGERLFIKGELYLALSRAHHLLLVGDGADWVEALAGHDRWRATYQLDWWHLTNAIQRTFPEHPQLAKRLKHALYRGEGDKIIAAVRLAKINGVGDPERVESLLSYLETNQAGFYGARSLRPHLSPKARLVCVEGSGAVEKSKILMRAYRSHHMSALQGPGNALDPGWCQSPTQTSHQGARQGRLA